MGILLLIIVKETFLVFIRSHYTRIIVSLTTVFLILTVVGFLASHTAPALKINRNAVQVQHSHSGLLLTLQKYPEVTLSGSCREWGMRIGRYNKVVLVVWELPLSPVQKWLREIPFPLGPFQQMRTRHESLVLLPSTPEESPVTLVEAQEYVTSSQKDLQYDCRLTHVDYAPLTDEILTFDFDGQHYQIRLPR